MIIRYRNGSEVEGLLLSYRESSMRVALRGAHDACELRQMKGAWMTEDCEPVQVEFECEQKRVTPTVTVNDCICPPELVERLLQMLFSQERDLDAAAFLAACGAKGRYA